MTYLKSKTVKDIIEEDKSFELTFVHDDTTLADVLSLLKEKNILSCPVGNKESNKLIGVIDMLDIVTVVVAKFSVVSTLVTQSFQQMEAFANTKVKDVLDVSGRNKWKTIPYTSSISELIEILSKPDQHRVFAVNEKQDVVGVITQSRLIQWLYHHKNHLSAEKLASSASTVGVSNVLTINWDEFVIKALQKLWDSQVSSLAVVDDHGKLIANFSSSDLKSATVKPIGPFIGQLYEPLHKFLNIPRNLHDKMDADFPTKRREPIIVHGSDSIEIVISKIVERRVHRVFACDTNGKPTHVLALSNILSHFKE